MRGPGKITDKRDRCPSVCIFVPARLLLLLLLLHDDMRPRDALTFDIHATQIENGKQSIMSGRDSSKSRLYCRGDLVS